MINYSIWLFCSFIFIISMSQTISVINRSGACYFLHASNWWRASCVCACDRTHQMNKTESSNLCFQSGENLEVCPEDKELKKYIKKDISEKNEMILRFEADNCYFDFLGMCQTMFMFTTFLKFDFQLVVSS